MTWTRDVDLDGSTSEQTARYANSSPTPESQFPGVFNSRLATRVIVWIMLVSSFVALLITSIELYYLYRQGKTRTIVEQQVALEANEKSLIYGLWGYDKELLRIQIEGLLSLPSIDEIVLTTPQEEKKYGSPSYNGAQLSTSRKLEYNQQGFNEPLGTIQFNRSVRSIQIEILKVALTRFLANLLKTIIVATASYYVFYHLVVKRLQAIQQAFSIESLVRMKRNDIKPEHSFLVSSKPDELDIIIDRLNYYLNSILKLQGMFNSIGDGIIVTDEENKIIALNPNAEKLTGWDSDAAVGKKLQAVFQLLNASTRQPIQDPFRKVFEHRVVVGIENGTILIQRSGSEIHISDSAAPLIDSNGEIKGQIIIFQDVTQEYVLRKQLVISERMEAIGQLVGGIAHDFNNTLSGILGSAELLSMDPDVNKSRSAVILCNDIVSASRDSAQIIGRLLEYSRSIGDEMVPVNLSRSIESAIGMVKNSLGFTGSIRFYVSQEAAVVGDKASLMTIFVNLLINAIQATECNEDIEIQASKVFLSKSELHTLGLLSMEGFYWHITIEDHGTGIEPQNLENVFDPFYTTKGSKSGTGLGLASVLRNIKSMGGAISLESEINHGTIVNVWLRHTDTQIEREYTEVFPKKIEPIFTTDGSTILFVDDEKFLRVTGEAVLKQFGYQVILAENGRDAVQIFLDDPTRIDMVLMDYNMPGRDGLVASQDILAAHPDARIVMMSGYMTDELKELIEQHGILCVLRKPLSVDDVISAVQSVLN